MVDLCSVIHDLLHITSLDTCHQATNFIADNNNEAEGAAEEVKICLGWELGTRQLSVLVSPYKEVSWKSQVVTVIENKTVS